METAYNQPVGSTDTSAIGAELTRGATLCSPQTQSAVALQAMLALHCRLLSGAISKV